MNTISRFGLIVILFLSSLSIQAQQTTDYEKLRLGVSAQFYPAGFIPTVVVEPFLSEKWSLLFRAGGNFTDRQDFSEFNDNEEGSGFGGSAGIRRHFPVGVGTVVASFITDVWSLDIEWTNFDDTGAVESFGTTDITVLQPYLEGGYFYPFKNSSSQIGATLGFGREINVVTEGAEVAQDFILSLSLQYNFGL